MSTSWILGVVGSVEIGLSFWPHCLSFSCSRNCSTVSSTKG